jgi:hypothetical protein
MVGGMRRPHVTTVMQVNACGSVGLSPELAALSRFSCLPVGAENKPKAPVDIETGYPLSGWGNKRYSIEQINTWYPSRCPAVGVICGTGNLVIIDIDGSTALAFAREHGCSPFEEDTGWPDRDLGWLITRPNARDRVKIAFLLTDEQAAQLGNRSYSTTIKPGASGDREEIAVLWQGKQAVVLGKHPSGVDYSWSGTSPENIRLIPPRWWELVRVVKGKTPVRQLKPAPVARVESRGAGDMNWHSPEVCGTCGRPGTGLKGGDCRCGLRSDGRLELHCSQGKSYAPPTGLKPGQVITGHDGQRWAFVGEKPHGLGDGRMCSVFVIDQPKPEDKTMKETNAPIRLLRGDEQLQNTWEMEFVDTSYGESGLRRIRNDKLPRFMESILSLRYNRLTNRIESNGKPIDSQYLNTLYIQLAEQYQLEIEKTRATDNAILIAHRNSYHPVQDYLNSLTCPLSDQEWCALAFHFFGLDDPRATLHLQRQLIGLAARAMEPGCKHDTSLVLVGPQGAGKSTVWEILGGEWFSGSLGDLVNIKDDVMALHASWLIEWGEVDSVMSKRESEALKRFLSLRYDDIRVPYGRSIERFNRSCCIVGTTNRNDFIKDPTGNRRFPIIEVSKIDLTWIKENRDRIWAKALQEYQRGTPHWYDPAENQEVTIEAASYVQEDPLREFVDTWMQDNPCRTEVCVAEILMLRGDDKEKLRDMRLRRHAGNVLTALGWERQKAKRRFELPDGTRSDNTCIWSRT